MKTEPLILQVVGYQNSGKTTVAENILRYLTKKGYKAGSFKHHGHGGTPLLPKDKDSTRLLQAGSLLSGVSGEGLLTLSTNIQLDWMAIYQLAEIDVLLIEGYKQKNYDKIVCIRSEEEIGLLRQLSNIVAIISWIPLHNENNVFSINDDQYCVWLSEYIENKMKGLKC
ncbi:molybdopterin-guanine dinucleotide biosynthesis protein B [Terrilactibacillus laevilacticus]|uniref:Molybdopterin-guanine dinucleotide biosynthesis protein B n=1 Tax=Terrilactibacillus laevilacticus TaxID=1380157 RepID=A0ABW5PUU8_9BACI|nr:molybdopterin-guanine dinucleotide biosynthesis protein B [Terrilactibacillus laevilacticus]